jgi:hypothetical protein
VIDAMRDIRETLVQRVERQVAGKGIPRQVVEAAVARVVDALDSASPSVPAAGPSLIAAFTARSSPDLASRVRQALRTEGVTDIELGIGTAGQHTVVTIRTSASARSALETVATKLTASLSILPSDSARA